MLRVQRGDSARHIIAQINDHPKRDSDRIDYRLSQLLIGIDRLQAGGLPGESDGQLANALAEA